LTFAAACPAPVADPGDVERYTYQIKAVFPHDSDAFTQGLVWRDGYFYEGTGLYGRSSLRKVEPVSGAVEQQLDLASRYFGEGVAILGDRIYQLTWRSGVGFVYDLATFDRVDEFAYDGEGWGLTHDGARLIMSDGTSTLRFLDPATFEVVDTVDVRYDGSPVRRLNELEYIDGKVYANIWRRDEVAIINPETGVVESWIDLEGLPRPIDETGGEDVLNGIAYDAAGDRLFVTGKLWAKIYEIELVPVEEEPEE
jgi:glutamine cyclotransferase